jgi:hypothetical protein
LTEKLDGARRLDEETREDRATPEEVSRRFFSPEGVARAEYWMFTASGDRKNDTLATCPRMMCRALDGKVFRKDDPIARSLFPPVHRGCHCTAVEYRDVDVRKYRLTVTAGSSLARR